MSPSEFKKCREEYLLSYPDRVKDLIEEMLAEHSAFYGVWMKATSELQMDAGREILRLARLGKASEG